MSQYQMLYSTPYLYSSRTLQQLYKSARKEDDITAIQ
ncbi:phage protein, partial [Bacillus thuringiensis]|nr:phage protein [Bacillus thuringiensis]